MAYINDTTCCGLKEIEGLDDGPESALREVGNNHFYDEDSDLAAFYLFSDAVVNGNGDKMAKYITKNKLGTLYPTTRPRRNPNTDRKIKVWLWGPHLRNFKRWYSKHKETADEHDDSFF